MTVSRVATTFMAPILAIFGTVPGESFAAESPGKAIAAAPVVSASYADLADLADHAPLVLRAKVKKIVRLDPKQASNVRPGWARLYIEAVTENLLTGPAAVGEALKYLADVKLDAKGKLPKLAKQSVLLFASHVPGRPGEIQLVAPDAQLAWDADTEARLRGVLREIYTPDAPRRVSGVQEAFHTPGTLAGEGETQIFLKTPDGEPASITVLHHAGVPSHWGISFTEIVATTGVPPRRDTLVWYRLACFLPRDLPAGANLSTTDADKAAAAGDYRKVMADLGPCQRNRN